MTQIMLFLHTIGALVMGFYFLMPLLIARASKQTGAALAAQANGLRAANRIVQFALLFEFLTGGFMISQKPYSMLYSALWLILVLVFLVALGGVGGVLGARLKKLAAAAESGADVKKLLDNAVLLSWLSAVLVILLVFLMTMLGSI